MVAPSTSLDAAALAAMRAQRVQLARADVGTFVEFVMRDERTGAPLQLAPMHEEWHQLIDTHPRLVVAGFVESGKSNAITIGRALFELGRDPTKRIAILSNTYRQASKLLGAVAKYIERSAELAKVFPALKQSSPWSSTSITVQRPTISKDPSVQALGVHGAVLGSRLDLVLVDDLLDYENTRTPEQRLQVMQWFDSTVLGRVVAGGRVVVLGSAWHPEDVMHVLAARGGWASARYGVTDEDGVLRWPGRWDAERIAAKRLELGPLEAARQLDCLARADESSRFQEAWIVNALDRGRGRPMVGQLLSCPPPAFVTVGVDLAVSAKRTADRSSIATVLVHGGGRRELLSLESGRWDAPTIIRRVVATWQRFGPISIVVESNAAQMYISQMLRELSAVPVVPFMTGRGKMSLAFQCELLAAELANGAWTFCGADTAEVQSLARELLYYSVKEHTGDRLASLLFARWGAEQATRFVIEHPAIDMNRR